MSTFARNLSSMATSSAPADTTSSALQEANSRPSGGSTQEYLTNCKSLYSCIHCRTHLANHDELVSRSFQGSLGRAYLFNSVINISCGQAVQRQLNTGSHAVADIFCSNCERTLGWKYEKAFVETQKYKEGKYIIELAHVVRENRHLELDKGQIFLSRHLSGRYKSSNKSTFASNNIKTNNVGSLTYDSSSSPMSSPTDSAIGADSLDADNDEEELMFPFYDDLCASRSSYPGNLSMSHHERARRSLYLESKPYDWKNSPASSSSSPMLRSTTDSILSSNNPSSPTSSSDSRSECCHADNNNDDDDENEDNEPNVCRQTEAFKAIKRPKHERGDNNSDNNQDYSETQFKLEDDLPHRDSDRSAAAANKCRQHQQQFNSDTDRIGGASTSNGSGGGRYTSLENNNDQQLSSGKQIINLDDEEFFDCYSEHDVNELVNLATRHP